MLFSFYPSDQPAPEANCWFIEFHGLDPELLLKALNILVKRGKAQIFGQDDSQGVKFF